MRTPGPCLLRGRAKGPGGRGEGVAPSPPGGLPSPTSPDGRLPCLHPVLAPCGPPRPARLGEGAGALSWADFPLPRLCLCPLPSVFTFLSICSPLFCLPFSPPFSPFPFLPYPACPLLFHLSFLPAPGSPRFGLVGGHHWRRGRGPCELPSPPTPATPPPSTRASPRCLPRPRGSPALRPTRIRECLRGGGWAGADWVLEGWAQCRCLPHRVPAPSSSSLRSPQPFLTPSAGCTVHPGTPAPSCWGPEGPTGSYLCPHSFSRTPDCLRPCLLQPWSRGDQLCSLTPSQLLFPLSLILSA